MTHSRIKKTVVDVFIDDLLEKTQTDGNFNNQHSFQIRSCLSREFKFDENTLGA